MMEAIAVCLFGMEKTVSYELKNLGFEILKVSDGRVTFKTDSFGIAKANISLRTAERILIKLGEFYASNFNELFEEVKQIELEKYIGIDDKFYVSKVRSINSKIVSQSDVQSIVKKAMVDRLKTVYGVEWFSELSGECKIHIFISKDIVEMTIDTSGEALHKRGYRKLSGEAPLRETIAAYMVMLTPWKSDRILVDPMCGSGTIAIEAALYGANIMPGVNRSFAGENLSCIPKKMWDIAKKEAIEAQNDVKFKIFAFDIDEDILELAKENAEKAGVSDYIDFKLKDAKEINTKKEYGFIITNPPYGERMGERNEVIKLYGDFGKMFKKLPKWSLYMISSLDSVEEILEMKATKKKKIFNGSLKSHIFLFPGEKPKLKKD